MRVAGGSGTIDLEVHDGTSWNLVNTFVLSTTDVSAQQYSVDISAYADANTQIRFIVSSANTNGKLVIDNVQIEYTPSSVSFQQGVNGYTGTEDTTLRGTAPATSYGIDAEVQIDLDDGGTPEQGLIRFDNIFGYGADQVPFGSTINSVSLVINVTNPASTGATVTLHRMLTSWDETSTWNSMVGGLQTDDVEVSSTVDATLLNPDVLGTNTITGLESIVQTWSDGATNYGWAIFTDATNGLDFSSSEEATIALRPELIINFTPVNNVPVATGNTVIASEDVPLVIGAGDFNFTYAESDSLASVTITGLNLNGGTLTHSAGAVTVTNGMTVTAAQLADLTFTSALNDSTNSSFTYTVNDAGTGITSAVMNITVNAVPVNTVPGAQVVLEDTPLAISGISVNHVDGNLSTVQLSVSNGILNVTLSGAATISAGADGTNTLTLSGTQGDINATLASLIYQGNLNYAGADTLTVLSTDSNAATDSDMVVITVNAVNDASVVSIADTNLGYASGAIAIDPALTVSDVDDTHLESAIVRFGKGYIPGEDTLVFADQLGITGNFANGTLTLTGTATVADYQTALRSVQYEDVADPITKGLLKVRFTVNDGTDTSNIAIRTIELVNGQNPRAGDDFGTVAEGGFVDIDLAINDTDDVGVDLDTIIIVTQPSNGTVTVTGGGFVRYTHDGSETLSDTFQYTIKDGGGLTSNTANVSMTVTAVNDAPVIAIVDVAGTITEGTTLTDSGSITFTDLDLTDTPTASEVTQSVTTALTLTAA